jgi:hypothetical protein
VGFLVELCLTANNVLVQFSIEMGSLESLTTIVFHNIGVSLSLFFVLDPIFAKSRELPYQVGQVQIL